MTQTMKHSPARRRIVFALALLAAAALSGAVRAATLTNAAGATADIVTAESDSGAVAANAAGAALELAGCDQASLDAQSPGAAWLYAGLLDPPAPASSAAERNWALYE